MRQINEMYTEKGKKLKDGAVFCEYYPRPMLKRDSFFSLNGIWDFGVSDNEIVYDKKIRVPFCPESLLSEVNQAFDEDKILFYKKEFTLPEDFNKGRVILHFGAVDQCCEVYLNNTFVGGNIGGYDEFSFDITDILAENNLLELRVTDKLSNCILPYGKQCKNPKGMWYTRVSGIWQTVWIESVPCEYIKSIKIDVTLSSAHIAIDGINDGKIIVPCINKETIIKEGRADIEIDNPVLWTPENPYLYDFIIEAGNDRVESYFALRTLSIGVYDGKKRLLLNDTPYFFHGVLDQGYFPDGIFTPADLSCYTDDILKMKNLGFNMLRKHIKIEPEFFYSECDRLGMIVFQDMVNNGKYSFIKDTALPTVGMLKKNDKYTHKDAESRKAFMLSMQKTVERLYNHPSICQWTIFNEGWGQFCADEMYNRLRELDSSRFIDSASGWFIAKNNDFDSRHIYFKKLKVKECDKPIFISEFGGYSLNIENHIFNLKSSYGYGKFKCREDFVTALKNLYLNEVLPLIDKGLCATVYTQLSDVEDETNGLLTYDRMVSKVKEEEFAEISEKLKEKILK